MSDYSKINVPASARVELHDALALTGAEISLNTMPANVGVPFVHAHKENEEIYGILTGGGVFNLDGEEVTLTAGHWLRVAPKVKRQMTAGDEGITYLCIQVKAGSLAHYTITDAVL